MAEEDLQNVQRNQESQAVEKNTPDESAIMRRWQETDREALRLRTANEPPYLTQQMGLLLQFGRAIADETRILILALLAEEDRPMYGQELAERLKVTAQTISHHLSILKSASLIRERRENAYRYYSLDTEHIHSIRETFFADDHLGLLTKNEERTRVLAIFFKDGRLISIPVQRTKLRYVLEELACSFEWGRLYDEQEVNAILKQFHEDTARLRREMIDEKILMREQGRYWLVRPNDSCE